MDIKDKFGRPVDVGDIVSVGYMSYRSPSIRIGRVTKISKSRVYYEYVHKPNKYVTTPMEEAYTNASIHTRNLGELSSTIRIGQKGDPWAEQIIQELLILTRSGTTNSAV